MIGYDLLCVFFFGFSDFCLGDVNKMVGIDWLFIIIMCGLVVELLVVYDLMLKWVW